MRNDYFDRPLQPGDRIGLIGPSGAIREPENTPEALAARVEAMGFIPCLGDSVGRVHGYLSGDDAVRADDLHRMFADPTIRAVYCVRGGYGVPRLLDRIDWALLRANPKLLIGYSDITALHVAIHAHCGFPTLHAPMLCSTDALTDGFSCGELLRMLTGADAPGQLPAPHDVPAPVCVQGGSATGTLVGGNLSLLAALCGTSYLPDMRGKILFIEEIGEKTYAIDRMLTQLRLAGLFDACAAVVFGAFTDCPIEHPDFGLTLEQIMGEVVTPCGKPILANVSAGHLTPTLSLPMGIRCLVNASAATLSFPDPLFGNR